MTDREPPGYGFVPLPPSVRRMARDAAQWHRRVPGTLAGAIDVTLTTAQPLHLGSGSKHAQDNIVVQRAARVRGKPGIPGASLKGALRARYEAITYSCALAAPRARQDRKIRSRSAPDIKRARLLPSALGAALDARCTEREACPACALFGRMSLRGRITVTDLVCTGEVALELARIPERFDPNLHHVGDARIDPSGQAFEVYRLHGRKFGLGRGPASDNVARVEAIPARSVLTGQIRLFNVTPAELGGLFAALGCDPVSALKLGGGKAHGFGRVHARVRCRLDSAAVDPSAYRQHFLRSPDRWPDGEDRLVQLHQGAC